MQNKILFIALLKQIAELVHHHITNREEMLTSKGNSAVLLTQFLPSFLSAKYNHTLKVHFQFLLSNKLLIVAC